MKSNHKTKSEKEQRLLTYLSKKDKSEFEKLLEEAEKKKVPVRQCNIEDTACESCSG
jgi:tRNA G18 (ribose-2'-O)-methylase SpoU